MQNKSVPKSPVIPLLNRWRDVTEGHLLSVIALLYCQKYTHCGGIFSTN